MTESCCSLLLEPGRVAQSVMCLATDAYLTADPGVASSILSLYLSKAFQLFRAGKGAIMSQTSLSFKKLICLKRVSRKDKLINMQTKYMI